MTKGSGKTDHGEAIVSCCLHCKHSKSKERFDKFEKLRNVFLTKRRFFLVILDKLNQLNQSSP